MGGLFSILLLPVIVIILLAVLLFASISSLVNGLTVAANGGLVNYDESTLQQYADKCYAEEFSDKAYEDNILIVLVTAENCEDFDWQGWVGDHLTTQVNEMFGGNDTELGRALLGSVSSNYEFSLGSNLTTVVEKMEEQVVHKIDNGSAFRCQEERGEYTSHITNKTDLRINAETVDAALAHFTSVTDIPIVIVVDTAEDVFGKYIPTESIVSIVVTVLLLGLAIFLTVRMVRRRKQAAANGSADNNNGGSNNNNGSYNSYDGGPF